MNRKSVELVASLLESDDPSPEILAELKIDSRLAVAKLLAKRERRMAATSQECIRLEELHRHELEFSGMGYRLIAGVDEAGRGPLAGPVVIGAVILPVDCRLPGINDSKILSLRQREKLYIAIKDVAIAVNYSVIDVEQIDRVNIYQATLGGMYQVLAELQPEPEAALIDAMPLPALKIPCKSLINGDALSASIAAASIIAKVERDRIMDELDSCYPQYGFIRHKGYATPEHLAALHKYGPCPMHRTSFAPVKTWGALFDENQ